MCRECRCRGHHARVLLGGETEVRTSRREEARDEENQGQSLVGPAAALLGEAVIAFPPHDVAALSAALDAVLGDPARRRQMAAAASIRSSEFSWQRSAAEFSVLLREVAG